MPLIDFFKSFGLPWGKKNRKIFLLLHYKINTFLRGRRLLKESPQKWETIFTGINTKDPKRKKRIEQSRSTDHAHPVGQEPIPHQKPTMLKILYPLPSDSENPETFSVVRCEAVCPLQNGQEPSFHGSLFPQPLSINFPDIC